jgi:hypothetical protein
LETILRFTESPSVGCWEVDGSHPPPVLSGFARTPEEGVFPPSEINPTLKSSY